MHQAETAPRTTAPWTGAAFFALDGIPVIEALKAHWQAIRDEHLAAVRRAESHRSPYPIDIAVGRWLVTSLRSNETEYSYVDAATRRRTMRAVLGLRADGMPDAEIDIAFRVLSEACMAQSRALHPVLVGLLDPAYPEACVNYNFSLVSPGTVIEPHRGADAGNIRVHLCLVEAEGCVITVAGASRGWRDGEVFAFDDSNVHWVAHAGTRDRLVVIADFKKEFLRAALAARPPPGRTRRARPARRFV